MFATKKIGAIVCIAALAIAALGVLAVAQDGAQRDVNLMPSFTEMSLGQGSGYFSTVDMADVDGDGYSEVLSAGDQGSPEGIYLWKYSGTAWEKQQVTGAGFFSGVKFADISGDQTMDIVACGDNDWAGSSVLGVVIYKATVSSGSISWSAMTSPNTATGCDCVAVGDIDNSNGIDIAISDQTGGVHVFLNGGGGASWTIISINTGQSENSGVALVDLNNDGLQDVITTYYYGSATKVFLCTNSGSIGFDGGHSSGLGGVGVGFGIVAEKFNSDSHMDLAFGTRSNGVKVYFGNGCSGADSTWWTDAQAPGIGSSDRMQLDAGDINGDAYIDIAVALDGSGVGVLENNGDGTFTARAPAGLADSGTCYGCDLNDWDGDGDIDVAACGWGMGVHFYQNDRISTTPELPLAPIAIAFVAAAAFMTLIAASRRR